MREDGYNYNRLGIRGANESEEKVTFSSMQFSFAQETTLFSLYK